MKHAHRKSIGLALTFLTVAAGIACASWWNNDWQFRKRLTIDGAVTTAAASTGLAEVTLPVRLHAGNFGYFNDVDKTGADLRFIAADDKTPLEFPARALGCRRGNRGIWVKAAAREPSAPSTPYIWMYYGSANAKPASTNQVSDAALVASYDFSEASGPPRDSTPLCKQCHLIDGPSRRARRHGPRARIRRAVVREPSGHARIRLRCRQGHDADRLDSHRSGQRAGPRLQPIGPEGVSQSRRVRPNSAPASDRRAAKCASRGRSPMDGTCSASSPASVWRSTWTVPNYNRSRRRAST